MPPTRINPDGSFELQASASRTKFDGAPSGARANMLPVILKLKLATTAAVGLAASASPAPVSAEAHAMVIVERAASPVEVKLYDENLHVGTSVGIRRDGTMDDATAAEVKH